MFSFIAVFLITSITKPLLWPKSTPRLSWNICIHSCFLDVQGYSVVASSYVVLNLSFCFPELLLLLGLRRSRVLLQQPSAVHSGHLRGSADLRRPGCLCRKCSFWFDRSCSLNFWNKKVEGDFIYHCFSFWLSSKTFSTSSTNGAPLFVNVHCVTGISSDLILEFQKANYPKFYGLLPTNLAYQPIKLRN